LSAFVISHIRKNWFRERNFSLRSVTESGKKSEKWSILEALTIRCWDNNDHTEIRPTVINIYSRRNVTIYTLYIPTFLMKFRQLFH